MGKENERKLPDVLTHDFVICDNTLNRKGWRLLVGGIDMEGFLKNPVCCVAHNTWGVPVGKWKNLHVEGEQLLGTIEFDRNDEEAVKLYWKYADGYMSAVSLHIMPIEESDAAAMLVPGQRYSTITKSELLEISLVTVPGQKNAVKLSTPDGDSYELTTANYTNFHELNQLKKMEKEEKNKNTEAQNNSSPQLQELQKQLDAQKTLNAKNLVKLHQQRGVVQNGEVEPLTKLAETDYDTVEKMLDARTPTENGGQTTESKPTVETEKKELSAQLADLVKGMGGSKYQSNDERKDWTYYDWYRKDAEGLALMQKNDPERYKRLEAAFNECAKSSNIRIDEC